MKKDNVGMSPLKENVIGEAVHDSRKKADLLSEQLKSVKRISRTFHLSHKPSPTFLNCILTLLELQSC